MTKLITCVLISLFACLTFGEEIVESTKNGQLRGNTEKVLEKNVSVFLGIPYAEPPVNELRFRKPKPVANWEGTFDADHWPPQCPPHIGGEPDHYHINPNVSEDCLFLNIWSPDVNGKRPVLFFMHGGSLSWGSASLALHEGDVLAAYGDIVVVTINYRLGYYGFLYTGTDVGPGNMAFLDQWMALKWIHDNIESFGGDPDQVTISGQSAGSWSTAFHLLSPMSRDLFKRAVLFSGAPLHHYHHLTREKATQLSLRFAQLVGCQGESFTEEMIKCISEADMNKMNEVSRNREVWADFVKFVPPIIFGDDFLPYKSHEALERGHFKKETDILFGTLKGEGDVFVALVYPDKYDTESTPPFTKNETIETALDLCGRLHHTEAVKLTCAEIADFYFNTVPEDNKVVIARQIGMLYGDFYHTCAPIVFHQKYFKSDPTTNIFQYFISYKGKSEGFKKWTAGCKPWMNVCHKDELWGVFGMPFRKKESGLFDKADVEMSKQMMETISTFVRTGAPDNKHDTDWKKWHSLDTQLVANYYEFADEEQNKSYFKYNLKQLECKAIWENFYKN